MNRTLEIPAALAGIIVAAPVIFVLVSLIRRESEGPGIFSQERVGLDGRIFRCHKLRTMRRDAPNVPTHAADGAQITPIGRFLRRTKLDELPQLWNILKGEMSFVGPRPCLPSQVELIEERRRRGVLTIRPGITGLAQVNDIDMSDPVRLAEKDAEYLDQRSLKLDLRLIYMTIFGRAGQGDRISNG
ncbi:sugar transferase [Mesorhizobium sp. YIM 152430]|uniref:sugar transferase n=1 Tax=Mesorhizobium sp. YIM 152430 TaxID=3031761 RepID=UPI0023D97ED4|nr:sugar transferase [Mesorhizobium sp. YIM 152430]MDF1598897.1 sugar transferase [Mesorhizobium sp. YIM 152430]